MTFIRSPESSTPQIEPHFIHSSLAPSNPSEGEWWGWLDHELFEGVEWLSDCGEALERILRQAEDHCKINGHQVGCGHHIVFAPTPRKPPPVATGVIVGPNRPRRPDIDESAIFEFEFRAGPTPALSWPNSNHCHHTPSLHTTRPDWSGADQHPTPSSLDKKIVAQRPRPVARSDILGPSIAESSQTIHAQWIVETTPAVCWTGLPPSTHSAPPRHNSYRRIVPTSNDVSSDERNPVNDFKGFRSAARNLLDFCSALDPEHRGQPLQRSNELLLPAADCPTQPLATWYPPQSSSHQSVDPVTLPIDPTPSSSSADPLPPTLPPRTPVTGPHPTLKWVQELPEGVQLPMMFTFQLSMPPPIQRAADRKRTWNDDESDGGPTTSGSRKRARSDRH